MKTLIVALLVLVAMPASAQRQINSWQELGGYVGEQTTKMNANTAEIAALKAKLAVLTSDMGIVVGAHDRLLRAVVIRVCDYNSKVAGWSGTLTGLEPIPLGDIECPPAAAKWYIPYYIGPGGPP
ncbi:MAG: hypothetical protein NUV51_04120, partial [Sulfuricaulis sp.]|nr:hypothetical protein [Sulfuricaulis sp.]